MFRLLNYTAIRTFRPIYLLPHRITSKPKQLCIEELITSFVFEVTRRRTTSLEIYRRCFSWYLCQENVHRDILDFRNSIFGCIGMRCFSVVSDVSRPRTEEYGSMNTKKKSIKAKKKLKTNQLGQKGQDRVQMRKDRDRKKAEKQKLAERLLRRKEKKEKRSQTTLERFHQIRLEKQTTNIDLEDEFDDINGNSTPEMKDDDNDIDVNVSGERLQDLMIDTEDTAPQRPLRPPTFIVATGSRNVYVAKVACNEMGDNLHPRKLFASSADGAIPSMFRRGSFEFFPAASFDELPPTQQPEVAFLGRSNVGKSSLINALLRRSLALTSKQPGRTQQAYYYGLVRNGAHDSGNFKDLQNSASGFIVDLPGYGFAVGPDKIVDEWQRRTQEFLLKRRDTGNLKRLFLLQDARTGTLELDSSIQSWFDDAEIPYSIVITKLDCVGPATIAKHANLVCARYTHHFSDMKKSRDEGHLAMSPYVYATSAKQNIGISELLATIENEFTRK